MAEGGDDSSQDIYQPSKGPFGIYGMDHRSKIGEGHVFLFFVDGRVIQFLFWSTGEGHLTFVFRRRAKFQSGLFGAYVSM